MDSQGNISGFEWTEDNIAIAIHGMGMGISGAKIADELGCTRSAVMGKMHRMGIKSVTPHGHQSGVPSPWKKQEPKPPQARPNMMTINARAARHQAPPIATEQPVDEPVVEVRTLGKSFMELAPGDCRWPYGDVGDESFFFCGHEVLKDRPYCMGHCSIAYQPTDGLRLRRKQYEVAA